MENYYFLLFELVFRLFISIKQLSGLLFDSFKY